MTDPVGASSGTLSQAVTRRSNAVASTGTTAADGRRACVTMFDAKDNTLMYLEGQGNQRGYAMAALLVSIGVMMVLMSVAHAGVASRSAAGERSRAHLPRRAVCARHQSLSTEDGAGKFSPLDRLPRAAALPSEEIQGSDHGRRLPDHSGVRPESSRVSHSSRSSRTSGGGRGRGQSPAFGADQQQGRSVDPAAGRAWQARQFGGVPVSSVPAVRPVCGRRRSGRRRHHGCRQQEQGHLDPRVPRRDPLRSVDVPFLEREQSSRRRRRSKRAGYPRRTAR